MLFYWKDLENLINFKKKAKEKAKYLRVTLTFIFKIILTYI